MLTLAIETSCDETAAAILQKGRKVLSNIIASSADLHALTGGVVPEVAAREHLRQITPVVDQALKEAQVNWNQISSIAVTEKPGLISSLLVGVNTAETLAYLYEKPLIRVDHIMGHIYSNFLDRDNEIEFPILVLTVSGGHNELVLLKNHHEIEILGETLDDAAGEAFDKVARLLNLGFPGGPIISKMATEGDSKAFQFPVAKLGKDRPYDFSFSGLKTAVRTEIAKYPSLTPNLQKNIAASFQLAVIEALTKPLIKAAQQYQVKAVHLAGGVSANQLLRKTIQDRLDENIPFLCPKKMSYCTDNAAMIGCAGYFQMNFSPPEAGDFRLTPTH